MIEKDKFDYQTTDGRVVVLLPRSRKIDDKTRVYVGLIAGEKSYRHWTEDGKLWGEKDKGANLA